MERTPNFVRLVISSLPEAMDATIFSTDGLGEQGPGVSGAEEGARGGSGTAAEAVQAVPGDHGDGKGGREAVGGYGRVAVAGQAPGDRSDQEAGGGYGRVSAAGQDQGGSSGGYGRAVPVVAMATGQTAKKRMAATARRRLQVRPQTIAVLTKNQSVASSRTGEKPAAATAARRSESRC
ncbi:hypothetical protein U9M48_026189 [Paspalum notatum var. saurae]|uniref:Uncharacterized protein n=1 Tax=Paspalum notatum var. saurae TaxID=547442 RepID=A0AAQ3TVT9_PASNO